MGGRVGESVSRIRRSPLLWPTAWSALLTVLMLGGTLGRGFVLSYDMVWVPDLALGVDALGLGTALPRAVPSDAVVAVLDEVVPGELLQKLVLLGALVGAGAGAAALTGVGTTARLVAATVYVWNPFVVERLAIGHWPVLVGYGVLPWVLLAGSAWRRSGVLPSRLPVLLVLGSLSATTGLVTAVGLLAATASRRRSWAAPVVLVVAANVPWLVAGLLHVGSATSSATGADVFAPSHEGLLPAPLTFLTLGGIWNSQVVLPTRTGWLGVVAVVLLVAAAVTAVSRGRTLEPAGVPRPLLVCWMVGLGSTVVLWALPGATGWVASTVPGGGLLRDGSRLLALGAPLTAVVAGRAAAVLVRALPDVVSRTIIAAACAVVPVAVMPDAALGLSGRLHAVDYPTSYDELVGALPDLPGGDVALLPFQSYRAPSWNNGGRPVLAPLGRYLPRRMVVEDRLVVDGRPIEGEDPRAADVRAALASMTARERADGLRAAGVRLLVVEHLPGVDVPDVAGDVVWRAGATYVVDVGPGEPSPEVPVGAVVAMALAWGAWLSLLVAAAAGVARRARTRVSP